MSPVTLRLQWVQLLSTGQRQLGSCCICNPPRWDQWAACSYLKVGWSGSQRWCCWRASRSLVCRRLNSNSSSYPSSLACGAVAPRPCCCAE
jgi:hypothetical protein